MPTAEELIELRRSYKTFERENGEYATPTQEAKQKFLTAAPDCLKDGLTMTRDAFEDAAYEWHDSQEQTPQVVATAETQSTGDVPPWLPFSKMPDLLFADNGLFLMRSKKGRKPEVVVYENYLYTPKGGKREDRKHFARTRLRTGGKQKPFYPRYFFRARLHAIEEWRSKKCPTVRLTDGEQAAVNRYAQKLGAEVSTPKNR